MSAIDDSSMETSMNAPSPVRWRRSKAARIAELETTAVPESAMAKPTRTGCSSVPVAMNIPDSPWMRWS